MCKQKIISILTGVCLFMLLFCISVSAETVTRQSETGATWSVDTETKVLTVSGTGATGKIVDFSDANTREEIQTILADNADFMTAETVVIEEGITEISELAFVNFFNLSEVQFSEGLTAIRSYAFSGDYGLDSVTFPNSLRSIGRYAFSYCFFDTLTINDGLENMDSNAFVGCVMNSFNIPSSFIGEMPYEDYWLGGTVIHNESETVVFDINEMILVPRDEYSTSLLCYLNYFACEGMIIGTVDEETMQDLQYFGYTGAADADSVIGFLMAELDRYFDAYGTEHENDSVDKYCCIACLSGSAQEAYCIENGFDYTVLGDEYGQCGENAYWTLDTATGTMTVYGFGATDNAGKTADWKLPGVRHLVIKEGITEIGNNSFSFMNDMQTVTLPASLECIGENGLGDNFVLNRVTFAEPSALKELKKDAFYGCPLLQSLHLPEGLEIIGYRAFYQDVLLEDFTLPSTVKSIGRIAFAFVPGLNGTLYLPNLETLGNGGLSAFATEAFAINNEYFKTIDGVLYSADGKTLVQYPFGKKDAKYAIPIGVETIASEAFINNFYLRTLVIPETLKTISANVLPCFNLTVLNYSDTFVVADGTVSTFVTDMNTQELKEFYNVSCGESVYRALAEDYATYAEADEDTRYMMFIAKYYPILEEYSGMTVEDEDDERIAMQIISEKLYVTRDYPYIGCLASSAEQANCDANGYEYTLLTDFYCEAAGHRVEARDYAATCTSCGYIGGKGCLTCDKVLIPPQETPMIDHVDANDDGYCDFCGKVLKEETGIQAFVKIVKAIFDKLLALFRAFFGN